MDDRVAFRGDCNTTEILAPLIAFRCLHVDLKRRNLDKFTDNNTSKNAYARNRVRLQLKQMSFFIFFEIAKIHNFASSVNVEYIKSKENTADFFSRVEFRKFIMENKCELVSTSINELLHIQ